MTVARHCEPAKQSRVLTCTWIASQARNDATTKLVIASLRSNPETYLMFIWIASQARNDVTTKLVIASLRSNPEDSYSGCRKTPKK